MCEMLANQYFLTHRFGEALKIYEKIFKDEINDSNILEKMIVCYTLESNTEKAIQLLERLMSEKPDFAESMKDDPDFCPCYEVLDEIRNGKGAFSSEYKKYLALGILSLFIDTKEALHWMHKANELEKSEEITKIISHIEKRINQLH